MTGEIAKKELSAPRPQPRAEVHRVLIANDEFQMMRDSSFPNPAFNPVDLILEAILTAPKNLADLATPRNLADLVIFVARQTTRGFLRRSYTGR